MRDLRSVALLAVATLAISVACYQGGETLDLDLGRLEQRELRTDDLVLIAWIARTPVEHAKGLAIVEADRLQPEADGRTPAMLYDLRDSDASMPPFRLRMQPMDVAVLAHDGTVLALSTLPVSPRPAPGAAYVVETIGGSWNAGRVAVGTHFEGLEPDDH